MHHSAPLRSEMGQNARITAPQHFFPLHPNKQTRQDGLNAALCAKTRIYRTATAMAGSPQITDITLVTYPRCRRDGLAVMERRRLRRRKGG